MSQNSSIAIIPYDDKYAKAFHDLNMEWIEKYFIVEALDEQVLSNPSKYIIERGGQIIMAIDETHQAIGTAGMVHIDNKHVELSKMAVSKSHQGLGI